MGNKWLWHSWRKMDNRPSRLEFWVSYHSSWSFKYYWEWCQIFSFLFLIKNLSQQVFSLNCQQELHNYGTKLKIVEEKVPSQGTDDLIPSKTGMLKNEVSFGMQSSSYLPVSCQAPSSGWEVRWAAKTGRMTAEQRRHSVPVAGTWTGLVRSCSSSWSKQSTILYQG